MTRMELAYDSFIGTDMLVVAGELGQRGMNSSRTDTRRWELR